MTIRSQSDADDYKGKTLTGKATIYAKDGLELEDIRFKGDVDIIADNNVVAAAYADSNIAVAAAYLTDINIFFEGRTNVSGTITVIKEGIPENIQVLIRTRTPRTISAIVKTLIPTIIVGFEVAQVETKSSVSIAKDTKVGTIIADDGAEIEAEGKVENINVTGKVDNIVLSGNGTTNIKINNDASVNKIEVKDNTMANIKVTGNTVVKAVEVSGKANTKVSINDKAKVEKVEIKDSATANILVKEEATVNAVISSSVASDTTVTGEGEIGKIEATNPETIDTKDAAKPPVIEQIGNNNSNSSSISPEQPSVTSVTVAAPAAVKDEPAQFTANVVVKDSASINVTWKVTIDGQTFPENEYTISGNTLTIERPMTDVEYVVTATSVVDNTKLGFAKFTIKDKLQGVYVHQETGVVNPMDFLVGTANTKAATVTVTATGEGLEEDGENYLIYQTTTKEELVEFKAEASKDSKIVNDNSITYT